MKLFLNSRRCCEGTAPGGIDQWFDSAPMYAFAGSCGENYHSMYVCKIGSDDNPFWEYREPATDGEGGNGCAVSFTFVFFFLRNNAIPFLPPRRKVVRENNKNSC